MGNFTTGQSYKIPQQKIKSIRPVIWEIIVPGIGLRNEKYSIY